MMELQITLLMVIGLIAIWFGWRVFRTNSMVRSAFSLLASMVAIGGMFLVMEAEFLGVLQIMMMGTEMSIMAIFMMMYMMDPGGLGQMDMTHQEKPSIVAAVVTGGLALGVILLTNWGDIVPAAPAPAQQNHDLGMEVMQRSMMIFESAGTSILTAMVAALATALIIHNNNQKEH
ncbi:NADH-quinone oxidoreductase subunit J family protein [Fodinibius sediminis]|jgi:NADH:ubiquinone oxidoreductase subunit 6 (subunit J)|uniref:NADH-quinone oxidoreductase subunit J n=1 Tax=Fodinibius sediminis TaxID=1214077 RepID=A0A521EIP0_9BACT|nr:NADH-quinone oxidoreductase subunit J [Fodinibius sediminis]SMO83020.1 NADH dehydrogenase subunit J [Fodinibius sediminis]